MTQEEMEEIRKSLEHEETRTINEEEAEAFKMGVKAELYERTMTCMMEGKFYDKDGKKTRDAISDLVEKCDSIAPEYPLKVAGYARNKMNLRSVPIFILIECCKHPNTKKHVKKWTPSVVRRADELSEAIARYTEVNGDIGDGIKNVI